MKSLAILSLVVGAGAVFACSGEPEAPYVPPVTPGTGGVGGSAGSGGSVTAGTGGAVGGVGGVGGVGVGGTAGAGGATGGTAGTGAGTGGAAGSGNTAGVGPTGGMSGMTGMSGAAGDGPMGGMAGMNAGGMGGMAGMNTGGAPNAGTAGTGMAGTGTAGTGSAIPTVAELVGALDGHLVITPCGNTPGGDDCTAGGWRSTAVDNGMNHPCSGGRLEALITIPIGGVDGVEYDVGIHFYGVMEPRVYSNVMREAGGATNRTGSTPTGWATATGTADVYTMGDNNYNTYEMRVTNHMGQHVAQYFLNSDSGTGHYTLLTNYEKTITLIGGGQVRLRVYDANCTMIKNCGANGGTGAACATNARTVNIAAAMPQPAASVPLAQPALGNSGGNQHSGQWWLIDVTSVALAN
jgi:hypothetical protein